MGDKYRMIGKVNLETENGLVVYTIPYELTQEFEEWAEEELEFEEFKGEVRLGNIPNTIKNKEQLMKTRFFTFLKMPFGLNQLYRYAPECRSERWFNGYQRGDWLEILIIDDHGQEIFNNITSVNRKDRKELTIKELDNTRIKVEEAIIKQVIKHGPEKRDLDEFDDMNNWFGLICDEHISIVCVHNFGKYQVVKLFKQDSGCALIIFDLDKDECIWNSNRVWIEAYRYLGNNVYYVISDDKECILLSESELRRVENIKKYKSVEELKPKSTAYRDCAPSDQLYNYQFKDGVKTDSDDMRIMSNQIFSCIDSKGKERITVVQVIVPINGEKIYDREIDVKFIDLDTENQSYNEIILAGFSYALLVKKELRSEYIVDFVDLRSVSIIEKDATIHVDDYYRLVHKGWRAGAYDGKVLTKLKTKERLVDNKKQWDEILINSYCDSLTRITHEE